MNTNQEVDKKIIDRIRKLLSLATAKSNSETDNYDAERDIAMKRALKLMAEHNLSMHNMQGDHSVKQDDDRINEAVVFRDEPWARTIVNSVAKLFFCYLYTSRSGNETKFVFIGRKDNVATAKEMAKYLLDSVGRESRKNNASSAWKTSFRKGAAHKIWTRSVEMREEAEKESAEEAKKTPGTALVLSSLYEREAEANQRMLATLGVKIVHKDARTRKTVVGDAYDQGQSYGARVGLNKQIS